MKLKSHVWGDIIMNYRHAALAGLLIAQPLAAQQDAAPAPAADPAVEAVVAPEPAAPMAIASPAQTSSMLRTGTELSLRLFEELTTEGKHLKVGDRFRMATVDPVMVNGWTVIPAGTPAVGEVSDVRNKGMWGKSGKLNARLLYVTLNGRQIRLSGSFDDRGASGVAGAVAMSALVFAPAGFFMTGTSARVPAGTIVRGYIDQDVQLALPGTAVQTPLAVAPGAAPVSSPVAAIAAADPLPPAPQGTFVNPSYRRPARMNAEAD